MTYFKVLNGYKPTNGGKGRYPGIGRWTKHLDPDQIQACAVGYHLADATQLLSWLGPTIYEAEPCPDHKIVDGGGKWVTCRVRLTKKLNWNDRIGRLFAADCAEAALLGERASGREPDERSWEAVEVARQFAVGEATQQELAAARDAARDAAAAAWAARAWDAARDAAWAARAAAWAARPWDAAAAAWAAKDAAWEAAAAARDAAWAAKDARAAAWAAKDARVAAWAAKDAAWAARDARDARDAGDAARDAAWAAARVAAGDAALAELSNRLLDYLYDGPIPEVTALYGIEEET